MTNSISTTVVEFTKNIQ